MKLWILRRVKPGARDGGFVPRFLRDLEKMFENGRTSHWQIWFLDRQNRFYQYFTLIWIFVPILVPNVQIDRINFVNEFFPEFFHRAVNFINNLTWRIERAPRLDETAKLTKLILSIGSAGWFCQFEKLHFVNCQIGRFLTPEMSLTSLRAHVWINPRTRTHTCQKSKGPRSKHDWLQLWHGFACFSGGDQDQETWTWKYAVAPEI